LFIARKVAGDTVREGQTLGVINSPYGEYSLKVKSPYDGYIIGHNNFPLIHRGDALFHIAQE